MPRFQIRPSDQAIAPIEIIAPDAARVLNIVERLDCRAADVFRDGEYCFSADLGESGMWCIFQRDDHTPGGGTAGGE